MSYHEGGWHRNIAIRGVEYYPPGDYPDNESVNPEIRIPDRALGQLIDWLRDEGFYIAKRWVKPEGITREDREPDLQVINRLLGIVEKVIE